MDPVEPAELGDEKLILSMDCSIDRYLVSRGGSCDGDLILYFGWCVFLKGGEEEGGIERRICDRCRKIEVSFERS